MSTKRVVLVDLGWCIGRLSVDANGIAEGLIISSPADTSPDRYAPAESVCIMGRGNILALKDFLEANFQAAERSAHSTEKTDGNDAEQTNVIAEP